MTRLNILCEGHTEETFANRVLRPHLSNFGIFPSAQLIPPRKKGLSSRAHKGGWVSYGAVKKALLTWMKSDSGADAWYTTMLDLYAVPDDFPHIDAAKRIADARDRVAFMEEAFKKEIAAEGQSRFIPYLQLHEFEALIFADPSKLDSEYLGHGKEIAKLVRIAETAGDPELINDHPDTAPSKRLIAEIPGYAKVKSGAIVTDRIGLPVLRERCKHFGAWLSELERLSSTELSK